VISVETVLGDHRNGDGTWNYLLEGDQRIGYLRITAFSRDTAADVQQVLQELTSKGLDGLILDLRFNPGGLLSAAVAISDMFISDGAIVSTEGRNTKPQVYEAHAEGTFEGFPIAVLVNGYSASASEILAACLQDHERGVVIGERTWGKGSVQNVIELEGGRSALKLTTASYKRPSGKNIHRFEGDDDDDDWGVLPTEGYAIKLNGEQTRRLIESRRERDIVRIRPQGSVADKAPPDKNPDAGEADAAESGDVQQGGSGFVDPQLQKAREYLQGLLAPAEAQAVSAE
jgi:carboxyl-terminal processing protease